MTQQVNLYTDAFKPRKVILSLDQIVLSAVAMLALLVLITFLYRMTLEDAREDLVASQAKETMMIERVSAMEKEVSLRVLDESLVLANQRLKEKIRARESMIGMLEALVLDDQGMRFSEVMIALARQNLDSLWLERIELGLSGQSLSLKGTALNAESVPTYLQKLRQESAFVGRNFTLFQLEIDPENSRQIHFELTSSPAKDAVEPQGATLPVVTLGGLQ